VVKGKNVLSLVGLARPFPALKALDIEELAEQVKAVLKGAKTETDDKVVGSKRKAAKPLKEAKTGAKVSKGSKNVSPKKTAPKKAKKK